LTSLAVDTDVPQGVSLLGKNLDDLQEGIGIGFSGISGTLHYVTGYTGFSGDPEEQEGNYLVLHCDSETDGATIKVRLIGGKNEGWVTLDSDKTIILRIMSTDEKVVVASSADGKTDNQKVYDLKGLVLEPKEES